MSDVFLVTTTNLASGRSDELERFIASVEQFRADQPDCQVRSAILFQNAASLPVPPMPDWVTVHKIDGLVSLSKARNILLATFDLPSDNATTAIVAFPDDDAWYPRGSLQRLRSAIVDTPDVDFALCRYGSDASSPTPDLRAQPAMLQTSISYGSSNTIVLRASLAAKLSGFADDLGLGTLAGSGEDTDYAIRAWHAARKTVFFNARLIGHRDNSAAMKRRYFKGSLDAIARNAHLSGQARIAHLRKRMIGFIRTLPGM
ncbi:glycosyltransferase family 2 protein [Sphingomonas sp. 35-24ZXX]|uniref:glycosyltransferase family 2 protein n=1 Tax=Sphingomonas sp. 35-24ZXX TaxID=1545915 RepID=UPI00053BFF12|nr:glycosyltransferase family A protein [Sphingomonas sp. 35-24ZXX]